MLTETASKVVLRRIKVHVDGKMNVFYQRVCMECGETWSLSSDESGDVIVSLNIIEAQVEAHLLGHVQEALENQRLTNHGE